jgi:hypothetical protein
MLCDHESGVKESCKEMLYKDNEISIEISLWIFFFGDIINIFRDLENYFGHMDILTLRFFIIDLKIYLKTWKIQCRH